MKGVKFGEHHTYDTWGLLMTPNWEIGLPEIKEKKIAIEGADGDQDYTDFFGGVKYGNRTLKFEFVYPTLVTGSQFMHMVSEISDALHGQKLKVVTDDDIEHYYVGRAKVTSFNVKKGVGTIEITVDAEPYKLKNQLTIVSATIDGTTKNLYDISKTLLVSAAIKKHEDDFFEIDGVNNNEAWQYITFFHDRFAEGEIAANQNVTIMLETKDFAVSGETENVFFYFTSHTPTAPDYFAPSNHSTRLATHVRKTQALYPAVIRDEATIAAATYFIRSFIGLAPKDKCKGKFRLSILLGDVKASDFVYTSHDGNMKGLQLINGKKKAVPTITTSSAFTIYFEGKAYSVGAGSSVIPELELKEGINDVAVKGTGTISFTWREGGL